MSNKIEDMIMEIQDYIDGCSYKALSKTHIVVAKDEIDELLRELRMKTPDEIKRCQKMISNRDAILADAKAKADAMIAEATAHTNSLVNEHEIMQQAYAQAQEIVNQASAQAQEIVNKATEDANMIRFGAVSYTDEMLVNMQEIIAKHLEAAGTSFSSYTQSMRTTFDQIQANRNELNVSNEELAKE